MHPFLVATHVAGILPDGVVLFEGADLAVGMERIGLVGPNGVGKTTLLEILAGRRAPDRGTCVRTGRIGYLPQLAAPAPGATVGELLGCAPLLHTHERLSGGMATAADLALLDGNWKRIERIERVRAQWDIAQLEPGRAATSLSGGELTRVRLAALLLDAPEVCLLDEPTNHLDSDARRLVHRWVREWPKGLVVASHDRSLLSEVDRIAEMTPGGIRNYGGNYAFYRQQRETEQMAANEALQSARHALRRGEANAQEAMERQAHRNARGRKRAPKLGAPAIALGLMKRAAEGTTARLKAKHEAKRSALAERVDAARRAVKADPRVIVDLSAESVPRHKRIASLSGVNHRFAPASPELWPGPMDLELHGRERVAIAGANGSGKSTLLGILRGTIVPTAGEARRGTERIGYLDQQVSLLDDARSVLENLRRAAPDTPEHELRILLGRFGLEGDAARKPARFLSGGERMRAGLACLLCADQAPELLLLDEPSNNLDLASQEALTSALRAYQGCLVLVSHDPDVLRDAGIERVLELRSAAAGPVSLP